MVSQTELIVEQRKQKIFEFFRQKWQWVSYVLLAGIVWLAVWIRTRNVPGLKDVTTGTWTLGPDLDPFLFLRWAKEIVENGSLFAVDMMRYVPRGFNTTDELLLHPYMMAWFHKVATFFGSSSVTYSAVIYPVFFFAITVIAFYLLTSEIFKERLRPKVVVLASLIAGLFLSILPGLLPRTIAGIPEKESAAFFFLFTAFYFYIKSWRAQSLGKVFVFGILAGLFTAGMALVWGGFVYIYVVISLSVFVAFFFRQINNNRFYGYCLWLFIASVIMSNYSTRYSFTNLLVSATTGFAFFVLAILCVQMIIKKTGTYWNSLKFERKFYSSEVFTFTATVVLTTLFVSALFGPGFIFAKFADISNDLIKPVDDRLGVTVAENRQPYFDEWAGNFGPNVKGVPLFFWLFFVGSIYAFYKMFSHFPKKEKIILTSSYIIFMFCAIFSRYASNSLLNGENRISIAIYGLGAISLIGAIAYVYVRENKNSTENLKNIDFGYLLAIIFFFFGIVSARGSVRTIMMLIPPASIVVAHLVSSAIMMLSDTFSKKQEHSGVALVLAGIIIVATMFSAYALYGVSVNTAGAYAPNVYTNQWQKAMQWVRESAPQNAVFGHWWDYGYWIQSIGERATVLDGGNSFSYWNHMMGRYALTGTSEKEALEFLYAHNTTHFLIDSTDIGKYGAFSSIGSDKDYDRRSWIPTFIRDDAQKVERKNSTIYVYPGGNVIDQDLIYNQNGTEIFLPGIKTLLAAVVIEVEPQFEVKNLYGVFIYQNKQYNIPIRYYYTNKLVDTGQGIDAGVFIMSRLISNGQGGTIEPNGALIYLSSRVVHSQLARLYLYGEQSSHFKLAHSEEDYITGILRTQGINTEFVEFQGFRGPIKIWEIDYPKNVVLKEEYLQIEYPEHLRNA